MEGIKKRLKEAFEYIKSKGMVHTQKELSTSMDVNEVSISRAFNGNKDYLTESFVEKFCSVYPIINKDWIWNDEGEMLKTEREKESVPADIITMPREVFDQISGLIETVKSQQDSIKSLSNISESIARLEEKIDQKGGTLPNAGSMLQ